MSRIQLTAWGDEKHKSMLEEIVRRKGYRSMSEALLSLIADGYNRLDEDNGDVDDITNIYKVMALISQGKVFPDAESIKLFLKGGSK